MSNLIRFNVLVIPSSDEPYRDEVLLPDSQDKAYFARLKDAVIKFVGDPIERVNVFYDFSLGTDFRYLDMFVNETGHLTGLPLNALATAIYQNNVLVHEPERAWLEKLPTIVGDAVLFEKHVWR